MSALSAGVLNNVKPNACIVFFIIPFCRESYKMQFFHRRCRTGKNIHFAVSRTWCLSAAGKEKSACMKNQHTGA